MLKLIEMLLIMIVHLLPSFSNVQLPCNSMAVICPHALTEFTCVQSIRFLQWTVPKINSDDNSQWQLPLEHPAQLMSTMGIYSASVVEDNGVYVSTLTFIGPTEVHNSNMKIICAEGAGDSVNNVLSCPFVIEGKPSSPINMTVMAIDEDRVNLSWSLPLSDNYCIDHHIASVNSSGSTVQNHTTNLTSIVISGLDQGLSYSFSVISVDYGGREGTISETVTLIMDVPGQVNSLNYSVNIGKGNYTHVIVNWNEGDNVLKPPVTHYNIYHNFTSSNSFETNVTSVTFYNLSCGTLYIVRVNAENIIGKGENRSLIIYIECEESCCISVTSAAATATNSTYLTSTLVPVEEQTILTDVSMQEIYSTEKLTAIETNTAVVPAPSNSASVQHCQIEIAVSSLVTAVLVSLISLLITSSVWYLLMKRNKASSQENRKSNTPQAIYDLPNIATVDGVGDKAMQDNAAYGVL